MVQNRIDISTYGEEMKRVVVAVLILMIVIVVTGYYLRPAQRSTVTPAPSPAATAAPAPAATPIAIPISTPALTPAPQQLSYTTGLPFEGEYKPVLAVIENSPAARPQVGLQTADIVYEVPVEGSITRFVCVFSDNVPEKVMPVRSGRVPFLYIRREWDSVFMHFGGSGAAGNHNDYSFYGHKLYDEIKFDIDGLKGKWNKYFYRADNIGAPHNVVGNPLKAQSLYDYQPEPLGWLFDADVRYPGDTVSEINLTLCSGDSNYVSYAYDPEKDAYLRSMNGKPFSSAETGEQVSVKNLIVQYSTYHVSSKIKLWNLVGEGKADFYIGGKMIKGSWKRESADSPCLFYGGNGSRIVLLPGNTWIHFSPQK